ncbi:uncharacterized protein BO87DRAFT_425121 [Aspergillus neoniger CBS 115656]|uniref:Uncharacterized protein n=1 Tax=Aspergillus neoniger (strain CBS 115656) TaxID=1448310 RepID=A0A318YLA2_ASPNB|nr:hypothetical protein BO87DRAFT_425121 [Aspergillus neoniger CBS 115656]PYH35036.1 hypothetical protein BO87DRAFT_425121 [Aspergillus neoniger CBS 115656]
MVVCLSILTAIAACRPPLALSPDDGPPCRFSPVWKYDNRVSPGPTRMALFPIDFSGSKQLANEPSMVLADLFNSDLAHAEFRLFLASLTFAP